MKKTIYTGSININTDNYKDTIQKIEAYAKTAGGFDQDVVGQLENLKIQESRLVEYLKSAEKIQDMLAIESELNRVRTEIDSRTTLIKNWYTEVAYYTIYVSVYEQNLASSGMRMKKL